LRQATERAVGQVWIKGEVSEIRVADRGHWFFTLRDDQAQLRCVIWESNVRKSKVPPPEGTEVYVLGTPTVWPQKGELRVTAVTLLPTSGVGFQQLAFERTREVLDRDGLFDPARKRSLPAFPRVMAVVSSPDGVVIHDIVTVARRRWPAVRIVLVPARVQGEDAVGELVRALALVNRLRPLDLCVVARGGGARDDLLAFNAEPVCRAVAGLEVPTISAVGHETDVTLTDLVADRRAATPSAAAELALPDRADVARHVASLASRLGGGLRRRTRVLAERLARVSERTEASIRNRVVERRRRLEQAAASLHALSPLAVLARGYSVAAREDGTLVKRRGDLGPGQRFSLRVSDGTIPARAE
jgi:exodeoxyribonuclease VII large subunit